MKKISIIDILIIAVIILAIGFVYICFSGNFASKTVNNTVSFTVEIKSLPYDTNSHIKVGDNFRDSIKGEYLGVVSDIEFQGSTTVREDTINGEFKELAFPDRCDAYITLKCDASVDGKTGGIIVGKNDIRIGKQMFIRSKNFAGAGYIVNINKE